MHTLSFKSLCMSCCYHIKMLILTYESACPVGYVVIKLNEKFYLSEAHTVHIRACDNIHILIASAACYTCYISLGKLKASSQHSVFAVYAYPAAVLKYDSIAAYAHPV